MEMEGKASDGKGRASNKKSKGSPGNNGLTAIKGGESGKVASGSGNDGTTQRCRTLLLVYYYISVNIQDMLLTFPCFLFYHCKIGHKQR